MQPRTITLNETHNVGSVDNWHFKRYISQMREWGVNPSRNNAESSITSSLKKILGMVDGKRIFLSKKIGYKTPDEFIADVNKVNQKFKEINYNGDELIVETYLHEDCYLSFIDNWDPFWHSEIDGEEKDIKLLFSTFKSISVPKGYHTVHFYYNPLKKNGHD
jgi:uncharacterized membrane protein YfhO